MNEDPITARMNSYTNSGRATEAPRTAPSAETPSAEAPQAVGEKIGDELARLTGTEKLKGFSLSAFFSDVFSKHSETDIEDFFSVGTARTTPPISSISAVWPRPWLFFRALLGSIALYALFRIGYAEFSNGNLIPGLMLTGTVAIPCSVLILFVEMNVARNVSLYRVLRVFLFGGIFSLLVSLLMFNVAEAIGLSGVMGDSVAGVVEESGKLAAVVFLVRSARYPYRLNALLFGAAVGTGFAVFESLGYALNFGLISYQQMIDVIFVRGCLAPFGHIIWTAITAAALWRIKGRKPFAWSMLIDMRFLRLALASVVMHACWNYDKFQLPLYGKYIILGVIGWTLIFILMNEGLKELKELNK